ncbi:MAG TPA: hypothetical protein VHB30_11055 [Solirubrobacteraceae bacterium]|nr:hypothetical protein [Solirubrobacteraceae bacterium]
MPTIRPKDPKDLLLAPVAAEIDANLDYLRDTPTEQLEYAFQLRLNDPLHGNTREDREQRVLQIALDGVDMHGWTASITEDGSSVRVTGGSVSVDIGLGRVVGRYILGLGDDGGSAGPR